MKFNYDGLWKLLIDRKMKKKDLTVKLGISPTTIFKMGKGESISLTVLGRIAVELGAEIGTIVCLDSKEAEN